MMLSEMFKNYPQPDDYIPNNRPKCHKPLCLDIMAGETAIHTFEVPLKVDELEGYEVIYKLGLNPIIIKNNYQTEYIVDEDANKSIITCTLYPEETKLFGNDTLLDARVQLKFYMLGDVISYSDIYRIKLKDSLDMNREKPDTQVVAGVGYGYTED